MKTSALLFLSLVLFSIVGNAQTNPNIKVTVKGQVVDSLTSETIPYATVKVVDKNNPTTAIKAVPTDDNGKFRLEMNKEGEYLMIVQLIGKKDLEKPLTVSNRKDIDFGKMFMADNSQSLNQVVVSAQRPLVAVEMDKIIYNMEEDPESSTNNLLEMFKKVPLVTVDGEENIQLKGSSNFKIYLNGKPSNMISNNPKDVLKSMPANSIKDIQVITDPGAKYDAEGVTGIINIITKKQTSLGGYTATISSRVDNRGSYGAGIYTSMKFGKIGFTGNYHSSEYKQPRSTSYSETENYVNDAEKFLYQNGRSKNSGRNQFGYGELSYEIDTLNLINIGFNRHAGRYKAKSNSIYELMDINSASQYKYQINGGSEGEYGGTDLSADYQRTFSKKDQLLTFSYRLSMSPEDRESNSDIEHLSGTIPPYVFSNKQNTDAETKEHTFQSDFTTPFGKIHVLEAGAKYIIRNNNSNSGLSKDDGAGNWTQLPKVTDKFKHRNDIIAAYTGYSLKVKKWGFKTGLRFESTSQDVKYPLHNPISATPSPNFDVDYVNWVPSATVTYQLKPSQSIRLGYNMRIYRPGIWQLNPYENTSDPTNIRVGNPNLDAVKNHSINTNYMFFNPKLNINVNASYGFENNGILDVTSIDGDVKKTTYSNIGKNKFLNLSLYASYSPTPKWRMSSNMWGGYKDLKSNNNSGLSNNGFNFGGFFNSQYTLPWTFRVGMDVGYFGRHINLQGKSPSFYFYGLSLMKGFMNDKLTFNAFVQNPFHDKFKNKNSQEDTNFRHYTEYNQRNRIFGIRVSFRFGEMKAQIKKAQRGIHNDDAMSGGGGGQSSGGQSGGQ